MAFQRCYRGFYPCDYAGDSEHTCGTGWRDREPSPAPVMSADEIAHDVADGRRWDTRAGLYTDQQEPVPEYDDDTEDYDPSDDEGYS